jgi:hypothetical protein
MSNKLSNNFVKIFLMLVMLNVALILEAFEPEADDFENTFQYKLYQSWLKKGDFKTNFPAGFGNKKIVKSFADKNGRSVQVEYDWINSKITDQRESLPVIFFVEDFSKIKPFLNFLEGFIYRLNTADYIFLQEYCDLEKIKIEYNGKIGAEALNLLWETSHSERTEIKPIELELKDNILTFYLPIKSSRIIKIEFPVDYDIAIALKSIRRKEEEKSVPIIEDKIDLNTTAKIQKTAVSNIGRVPRKRKPEPDIGLLPEISSLTLSDYVKSYHAVRQSKELLHNKISDPVGFLFSEFPQREIREEGNMISVLAPKYQDDFSCEINVDLVQDNDGINFTPTLNYELTDNSVIIGYDEEIFMNSLNSDEIETIAPFITQLAYEHRAIGSKLLNFLVVHDDIPTTLIMRNGQRKVYELNSYANLLLMLGNYWQSHNVYFKVQEVTKKNGNIELQTYLIAYDGTEAAADMAEIMFHLDEEFKVDMIMMILHQGNDRIDN